VTEVPWFPRTLSDLNLMGKNTMKAGESLINDSHPGFSDKEYIQRRTMIAELGDSYKMEDSAIPSVD